MDNRTLQISLVFVLAIAGIASFFYFDASPNIQELKKSVAPAASLYPEAKTVSDTLNFIDDESVDTHLSKASKGKWALLYFGYTSCPDVCPIDLSKINLAYQMVENQDELQVVFISVDPMRDIGKLNQFASAFNPSFLGLTAHQDALISISKSLGVYHAVVEAQKLAQQDHNSGKTAHYDIDHTSSYLLFNPELKLTALLTSPHEPKAMAKAIDTIIKNLR